jgi:hypothetical protein
MNTRVCHHEEHRTLFSHALHLQTGLSRRDRILSRTPRRRTLIMQVRGGIVCCGFSSSVSCIRRQPPAIHAACPSNQFSMHVRTSEIHVWPDNWNVRHRADGWRTMLLLLGVSGWSYYRKFLTSPRCLCPLQISTEFVSQWITSHMEDARSLGKPLVVEEVRGCRPLV